MIAKKTFRSASAVSSPSPTTRSRFSVGVFVTMALAIWRAYSWPIVSCPEIRPPRSEVAVRLLIGRRLSSESGKVWAPSVPGFLFSNGTCNCHPLAGCLERIHCILPTQWPSRPFCEIVTRILSLKLMHMTAVWIPLTSPATCLVLAGKGRFSGPWSSLRLKGSTMVRGLPWAIQINAVKGVLSTQKCGEGKIRFDTWTCKQFPWRGVCYIRGRWTQSHRFRAESLRRLIFFCSLSNWPSPQSSSICFFCIFFFFVCRCGQRYHCPHTMPKFVPRQRKQKHRQKEAADAAVDSNAAEVLPVSKEQKEAKRQKLREELRAQHTKISAKKQKRLDKYIVCRLYARNELWVIPSILTVSAGK